jgi:hypothetical protein
VTKENDKGATTESVNETTYAIIGAVVFLGVGGSTIVFASIYYCRKKEVLGCTQNDGENKQKVSRNAKTGLKDYIEEFLAGVNPEKELENCKHSFELHEFSNVPKPYSQAMALPYDTKFEIELKQLKFSMCDIVVHFCRFFGLNLSLNLNAFDRSRRRNN